MCRGGAFGRDPDDKMFTHEQRKRLSELNRSLLKGLTTGDKIPAPKGQGTGEASADAADVDRFGPTSFEEAVPGSRCTLTDGTYYLIHQQVEKIDSKGAELVREFKRTFSGAAMAVAPDELHESLRPVVDTDPQRVFYLDIETCGFIGVPLFLVGLMNYEGGSLVVRQLLARNYSEERALLAGLWELLAGADVLVTFNGKSFDVPTIIDRTIASGIFKYREPEFHVDLLHEARRRWKRVLPNCRLQTLEMLVCGRSRGDDIPSAEIPAVYHEFVRSREADDPARRARSINHMRGILRHNALDLLTMAQLMIHIFQNREPHW